MLYILFIKEVSLFQAEWYRRNSMRSDDFVELVMERSDGAIYLVHGQNGF
jgi:hypothetical protein